ncbi:bifunctional metallophosphatase/5'-nucleotidase [Hippea alviniae]|uniref:bifunctional metallophosphatase/5'-nucleotidase n=1 Tax=Hippea alviniae TaxID=1279027 RepID=UPI0003B30C84|nr:5'-nucleotidase C-terminal domain-containing protein [Hippea alviniae]
MRKPIIAVFLFLFLSVYAYGSAFYHLTVVGTGDLQGNLEGISRLATLIKKAVESNPKGTMVVATGDELMGRYFDKFHGKAIYSLMYDAGYRFCVLGNHEFDKGDRILKEALGYAKCKFICSDLATKGTPLEGKCKKYLIVEKDGLKIGIFSLMTQELPLISSPEKVKLISNNIETAKKMVKLLKIKGADVIIALTHIGFSHDKTVAENVKGITLIFGGHSHVYLKKAFIKGDTVVVNGGSLGRYLVRVDLYFDKGKKLIKKMTRYKLIPVDERVEKLASVEQKLQRFKKRLPKAVVLGKTETGFDLRESVLRFKESGFADTINDILKDKFRVDVVFNNSGLFRGDSKIPKGNITDVMLHKIFQFDNVAFLLKLKGRYIKDVLEFSADSFGNGGWLQVAGIRYTVDLKKPKGERVSDITINGKPLDTNKTYTVLINDFLAKGGNGYFWFKKCGEELFNTYTSFYSIVASYLNKNRVLNEEKPDGRIKIIK